MPRLACRSCGRQIYTVSPLESLFAEERRCPRCGAFLTRAARAGAASTLRRQNPPDDPGPPAEAGERRVADDARPAAARDRESNRMSPMTAARCRGISVLVTAIALLGLIGGRRRRSRPPTPPPQGEAPRCVLDRGPDAGRDAPRTSSSRTRRVVRARSRHRRAVRARSRPRRPGRAGRWLELERRRHRPAPDAACIFLSLGSNDYSCSGSIIDRRRRSVVFPHPDRRALRLRPRDRRVRERLGVHPGVRRHPGCGQTAAETTYGCWDARALVGASGWTNESELDIPALQHDYAIAVVGPVRQRHQQLDSLGAYPSSWPA